MKLENDYFIGNKEKISDWIFDNLNFKANTFFDPFSGMLCKF